MTVHLTPQEAAAKIEQINHSRDQAVQKLRQIQDTQATMLASHWQGGAAGNYNNVSQAQHEEFDHIIATLNGVVEKGTEHIHSITNADSH